MFRLQAYLRVRFRAAYFMQHLKSRLERDLGDHDDIVALILLVCLVAIISVISAVSVSAS